MATTNRHQLSLEIPDTNNTCVFRIFDTSLYGEGLNITCGSLEITSPGFNEPVIIDVLPHFNLVLNACTLGIQVADCGTTSERLPDGVYHIKYSISPNDRVYVEYDYLRTTQTMNKYMNLMCQIELAACEPEAEVKDQLAELRLIKSFLDAAKIKVEQCHNVQEGMELLIYAQKRLFRFTQTCC